MAGFEVIMYGRIWVIPEVKEGADPIDFRGLLRLRDAAGQGSRKRRVPPRQMASCVDRSWVSRERIGDAVGWSEP
jgi:hypothetical protein